MHGPTRFRTAVAAIAIVGLTACGGGGGNETTTGSSGQTNNNTGSTGSTGNTGNTGSTGNTGNTGSTGGTTPPTASGCQPSVKAGFPQTLAALTWDSSLGADVIGEGDGGADGEGGFGIGGSLGKFIGADVTVTKFDGSDQVLGTARTDNTGMVTVNSCGYTGPLLATFKGNEVARYIQERLDSEDPLAREVTRFKSGEQLRVAVGSVQRNLGVSAFTEAAVSYLQQSIIVPKSRLGKSVSVKEQAQDIERANAVIADVLADQLPAAYRPESARGDGKFKITQLPVLVDEQQGTAAGTLDSDARGVSGAVNAGFGLVADTFLPRNEQLGDDNKSPSAVIAARQWADDLSDGRLDRVGSTGPVSATESPAYTYETLWRAKTIGTARTAEGAGTQSLAQTSAGGAIEVAHFGLSAFETYKSLTGGTTEVLRRTDLGQTVTLDSGGRLKLERRMSGQVGDDRNYVEELFEHDLTARFGRTFVEVKVGSMGEVVALTQDRRQMFYIDPASLYRITGSETVEEGRAAFRRAVEELNFLPFTGGADDQRVISFSPAPAARRYEPDPASPPPAIVFITSDGQLRAIFPNATWNDANGNRRPYLERWGGARIPTDPYPAPTLLQSVVFDKFAPPGHVAAYGALPATVAQPWSGPRRLYGLTRAGKVIVWLEGRQAEGVILNVPGVVIQLNADSQTGVYALTSEGRVFWLNADQAWNTAEDTVFDAGVGQPARRRGLNQPVEIAVPSGVKACWIGAEQAVDCASGKAYAWDEQNASIRFDQAGAGSFIGTSDGLARIRVPVQVGNAAEVSLATNVGRLWRLSAVEQVDFSLAGSNPRGIRLSGFKYLTAEGQSADKATVGAQRNILSDLICDLQSGSKACPLDQQFAYIQGSQLREAIRASLTAFAGQTARKDSFFPAGFTSEFFTRELGGDRFVIDSRLFGAGGTVDPSQPRTAASGSFSVSNGRTLLRMEFLDDVTNGRGFSLLDSFRFTGNNAQYSLSGNTLNVGDNDRIRLDRVLAGWRTDGTVFNQLRGTSNFPNGLGSQSHVFYVNLIPGVLVTESFGFRLCWEVRIETPDKGNGRKSCTNHLSDGTLTGVTVVDSIFDGATQSGPRIDFGDAAEDGVFGFVQPR